MEEFQLEWKEESENFEKDEFYENIRAPKWVDFSVADSSQPDDNAWFCLQAGCDQKHGTQLDQTGSNHASLLKVQASKTPNHSSWKLCAMEKKHSTKQKTSLSAPTSKARDRTPGKASTLPMFADRVRRKQSLENEDPNLKGGNVRNEKHEARDAEALSPPNRLSSASDMDASEGSPAICLINKTTDVIAPIRSTPQLGKDRIIKSTGAFTTPRLKERSIKPEPFRSVQNSKVLRTTSVRKETAVKSILFQTPRKTGTRTPSREPTPITKMCADMKKLAISSEVNYVPGHFCKSSRCAANDPNYFSPVPVPAKKYLAARSLQANQAGEAPLSRCRNLKCVSSTSSKAKDSRSILKGAPSPSSHRKALFSEAIVRPLDLAQAQDTGCIEDGPYENQAVNETHSPEEELPGTAEMNAILTQKCEAKRVLEVPHDGNHAEKVSETDFEEEELHQTVEMNAIQTQKCEGNRVSEVALSDFDQKCEIKQASEVGHDVFNQGSDTAEPIDDAVEEKNLDENYLMSDMEVDGESRKSSTDGEYFPVNSQQIETEGQKSGEGRIEASSDQGEVQESGLQGQSEIQITAIGGETVIYVVEEINDCKQSESFDAEKFISIEGNGLELLANVEHLTSLQCCLEAFTKEKGNRNELQMDSYTETENTGAVEDETPEVHVDSDAEPDNTGAIEEETGAVQGESDAKPQNRSFMKGEANAVLFDSDVGSKSTRGGGERAKKFQVDSDVYLQNGVTVKERTNEFQVDCLEEETINARIEIKSVVSFEDRNVDLEVHSQGTDDITDQNVLEDGILQEINTGKLGTGCDNSQLSGTCNNFRTLVQDPHVDGKTSIEVEGDVETILGPKFGDFIISEARQENQIGLSHLESKGLFCEGCNSDSTSESEGNYDTSQFAENDKIKSDNCADDLDAPKYHRHKEEQHLESKSLNTGLDGHENSSCPQTETIEKEPVGKNEFLVEHCVCDFETAEDQEVNRPSNSEVDSDSVAEGDKDCIVPQQDCLHQMGSAEEGPLIGSTPSDLSTTLDEKLMLAMDCNLNVELVTIVNGESVPEELDSLCCSVRADSSKTPVHEERNSESEEQSMQCTLAKPRKRRSSDINSKTDCSKGHLCQDESCNLSTKANSSSLAPEVNGLSALHGGKHKKIKPTCPKPFRLRTEERGLIKETSLSKKTDQFASGKESIPIFSVSSTIASKQLRERKNLQTESSKPDKAKTDAVVQSESSKLGKAKPVNAHKGKPMKAESSKSVEPKHVGDKEEMKDDSQQILYHATKMPFFGQPFKPQRSTKKLTVPKEPNFHPIHPRKTCAKNH